MYYSVFGYVWWLCKAINISVQYNGGLLPDIYAVDPRLLPPGNPFKYHVEVLFLQSNYIITTMFDDVLHCFCFLSGVPAWRLM